MGGLLILAYGIYFGLIRKQGTGGTDIWGQFGDFLGGLLNPIVGTITIILLVRTLMAQLNAVDMQREELTLQRDELKLQRAETAKSTEALAAQNNAIKMQSFEQTFFAWHDSYRTLVTNLAGTNAQLSGAQRLLELYQPFKSSSVCKVAKGALTEYDSIPPATYPQAIESYLTDGNRLVVERFERAITAYETIYRNHHSVLGPIYRTLYRLLDWIDRSSISDEEKWHYVAIARSQLSWGEMLFLAFNGLTPRGLNFVPLMNKYALLDNLEDHTEDLVLVMRKAFLKKPPELLNPQINAWRYEDGAFHSSVAKSKLGILTARDI
ncbi:hypothetical protein MyNCGM70_02570 [Achromobacter xylosoxidans]